MLALYKVRSLIESELRLRTACDLEVISDEVSATRPTGFILPSQEALYEALTSLIERLQDRMEITEVNYDGKL